LVLNCIENKKLKHFVWHKPKNYDSLSLLRENVRDLIVTGYKIGCKSEVFGLDVMLHLVSPLYLITLFPFLKREAVVDVFDLAKAKNLQRPLPFKGEREGFNRHSLQNKMQV